MQHSLIQKIMLYKFKMGHIATETTKNFCCVKGKGDQSTVIRWFKKFCSGCKNLNNQTRSGWLKTLDSKAVLQEANLANSIQTRHLTVQYGSSPSQLWQKHLELLNCVSHAKLLTLPVLNY